MFSSPLNLHLSPQHRAAAVTGTLLVTGALAWLLLRRPAIDFEERERARRERLAQMGRITDGSLVDTTSIEEPSPESVSPLHSANATPQMLQFRYRIAGVVYEAAQDVSALGEQVRGIRLDLPVQVRYDHENPANSIVVSEAWSGVQTKQQIGREESR